MCWVTDYLWIRSASLSPRSWELILLFQPCQNPPGLSIPKAPVQHELVRPAHPPLPSRLLSVQLPALLMLCLLPEGYPAFAGSGMAKREIEKGTRGYREGQLKQGAVEIILIGRKKGTHAGVSPFLPRLISTEKQVSLLHANQEKEHLKYASAHEHLCRVSPHQFSSVFFFFLSGPLLDFFVPRGLFCIGGESPIHQPSGSAINMQHLECMSWMTSWQSLRLYGPSLCLSLKRQKAPSQTLCQIVQTWKKEEWATCFSLPNNFTLPFLSPGHCHCEWPISHSFLLNFNIETEHNSRCIELIFLTACGRSQK